MADQVHSITDAPEKHSEDLHRRKVRYVWAMSIRAVCFILAALVAVLWQSWWAAAFVAAAAILPYLAVIDANATPPRSDPQRSQETGLRFDRELPSAETDDASAEPEWWEDAAEENSQSGENVTVESVVVSGDGESNDQPDQEQEDSR